MNEQILTERTSRPWSIGWSRASWGAIFAGMFVTVILQLMLTLLGTAIGFATINPMQEQNATEGMGLASGIWLLVTSLISVWIGACIAGRLAGASQRDGMLHGIVSWSVATSLAVFTLATATGALLGGAGSLLSNAVKSGAQNPNSGDLISAAGDQVKSMFPQAGSLLPPTGRDQGRQTPGQLTSLAAQDPDLAAAIARVESNKTDTQARDQVINLLTTKHNMDQQQAANLFNQWQQNAQQLQAQVSQKTREVGQKAAHGISMGALWGFIALFLGLLVSAWGGWAGAASLPRTEVVTPASPA